MLLQDTDESVTSVQADLPHHHLFPDFVGASCGDRYKILCERLMEQGLYGTASYS